MMKKRNLKLRVFRSKALLKNERLRKAKTLIRRLGKRRVITRRMKSLSSSKKSMGVSTRAKKAQNQLLTSLLISTKS
jgi:hypothetical protein